MMPSEISTVVVPRKVLAQINPAQFANEAKESARHFSGIDGAGCDSWCQELRAAITPPSVCGMPLSEDPSPLRHRSSSIDREVSEVSDTKNLVCQF